MARNATPDSSLIMDLLMYPMMEMRFSSSLLWMLRRQITKLKISFSMEDILSSGLSALRILPNLQ